MLRLRDREIIKALNLFRCMSRDQIAKMFFNHVKNPITSANFVLKRLRREKYIDANTNKQPYIYFPDPTLIKKNSQKVNHYLAIVDFYLSVCQHEKPIIFNVEKRYGSGFMQPDIFMIWRKKAYFVEIQNSRYALNLIEEKIKRYTNYLQSGSWRIQGEPYEISKSPYLWIVSKAPYCICSDNIQIIQTSNVEMFFQNKQGCV
ncbi:replication-relaxation family protein [Bacillus sp. IBL03825]|nr:replication-relaxation family protein [Bacillus sp. IBL03825]